MTSSMTLVLVQRGRNNSPVKTVEKLTVIAFLPWSVLRRSRLRELPSELESRESGTGNGEYYFHAWR